MDRINPQMEPPLHSFARSTNIYKRTTTREKMLTSPIQAGQNIQAIFANYSKCIADTLNYLTLKKKKICLK